MGQNRRASAAKGKTRILTGQLSVVVVRGMGMVAIERRSRSDRSVAAVVHHVNISSFAAHGVLPPLLYLRLRPPTAGSSTESRNEKPNPVARDDQRTRLVVALLLAPR
jgi:hypothetical protein